MKLFYLLLTLYFLIILFYGFNKQYKFIRSIVFDYEKPELAAYNHFLLLPTIGYKSYDFPERLGIITVLSIRIFKQEYKMKIVSSTWEGIKHNAKNP